ncbi:hypothetical protein [Microtetraspora malaysiensis]|uniref:hypothetical protein n=1 Tax=Microtetraspora malaysiensis TaxID=161358 RepID=UPI000B23DE1A|nr:hypothetical protein [Microtetraspora malaysiensis]
MHGILSRRFIWPRSADPLVGHRNTVVTETVYRKQIRPVLMQGAEAMDDIFMA